MKNTLFKKGLVIGIIILFIGVSVLSSVSSKDVSVYNDNIEENNVSNELFDNNEEMFTRIGACVYQGDLKLKGDGLIKELELRDNYENRTQIGIWGFKKPLYPLKESYFTAKPKHLYSSRFIGFCFQFEELYALVNGVAFGNIEWE